MKRINNRAAAVEAVLTRYGTVVGPLVTDLTGHPELAPDKGGWCGMTSSPRRSRRREIGRRPHRDSSPAPTPARKRTFGSPGNEPTLLGTALTPADDAALSA
jgi:hypothetical protein